MKLLDIHLSSHFCFALLLFQTVLEQIAEDLGKRRLIISDLMAGDEVVQLATHSKFLVVFDVLCLSGERLTVFFRVKDQENIFREGDLEVHLIDEKSDEDRQWYFHCVMSPDGLVAYSVQEERKQSANSAEAV